jgi:hypothetical protein
MSEEKTKQKEARFWTIFPLAARVIFLFGCVIFSVLFFVIIGFPTGIISALVQNPSSPATVVPVLLLSIFLAAILSHRIMIAVDGRLMVWVQHHYSGKLKNEAKAKRQVHPDTLIP